MFDTKDERAHETKKKCISSETWFRKFKHIELLPLLPDDEMIKQKEQYQEVQKYAQQWIFEI